MKKTRNLFVCACAIIYLLLCSCAVENTVFGIPQDQWDKLTPAQQQEVIKGYNEREQTKIETAAIDNAVDAARDIAHDKDHHHHSYPPHPNPPHPYPPFDPHTPVDPHKPFDPPHIPF